VPAGATGERLKTGPIREKRAEPATVGRGADRRNCACWRSVFEVRKRAAYRGGMPLRAVLVALLLVIVSTAGSTAAPDRWPQFRGPNAGVVADDPTLPERWSATDNVRWRAEVPGLGWSSPVVWDDHVFVTSVVAEGGSGAPKPGFYAPGAVLNTSTAVHRWLVHDVDFRTGALRWSRELQQAPPSGPKHLKNSYASETPVTDGERVYVYLGSLGLFAFDLSGKPVWAVRLGPFTTRNGWGTAASPVLHRGRLYVVNDNDDQSFIAAFDARTGRELWRTNRDEGTNWSTPFVWEHPGRTEIVTAGTDRVRSYDLDGRELWTLTGMSSITIPTPFGQDGLLYISSGYVGDPLRPTYAIRPGARGDVTPAKGATTSEFVVWSAANIAPYNPTPIVYRGTLYTLLDRGFFTAHDAKTGKELYGRQRITTEAAGFTASPWAYNGKIFALSEDGDTYVIQAGPEFKVLGKNSLGDMALATPAIVQDSVVIRTHSTLYRIAR
jgi:outer membrane protein assembly factor BamB